MMTTSISPKLTLEDPPGFDQARELLHRRMLSSVSHDLKTPLAAIIGALEVVHRMKDKLPEDKQLALTSVALQEAYRLDNFITNILEMARFENDMVKVNPEPIEIKTIIRNCLLRLDNRLFGSTVNFLESSPVEAKTDAILLSRALYLVLDNAVKYGGKPPVIYIEYGIEANDMGFIKIRDNGKGIPEKEREAIFSKYTRFAKEDQQNAGTGLGLAISRFIMNLLGGTISATNYPEGGALFTLHLPLNMP